MNHSPNHIEVDEKMRKVLSMKTRPPKPNMVSNTMTFCWRALLKLKYVPEQLMDVTVFPIMFLLMFTYLFGGAIAGSTADYLQFLLPGILAMTVITITMYTGMELNNDIRKGIFDRFRSLPIWRPAVLVGMLSMDAIRYTIASTIMIILGLIMGFRPDGGAVGVLFGVALLVLFSFSLSWIWTTLGLIVRSEKSLMGISMMVMFPLTFVSNVFVDPSTLPSWLEAFVDVNPISLLVTAIRGLMHGTATTQDIFWVLLASFVLLVIFAPLTMYLYRNKK
ncbi:ABC transporter permease [Bacillus alkalicellulosilyticus]|uniref:ABC transporter permease n=1 Tax=Alkalihalobacterium alkalicellulosilyticum TaxID=1912214 RepID=UPI000996A3E6|nr:ABC transporter permease [Bacillus alkalicellulosilyticus]